jgi:hypothetical protein
MMPEIENEDAKKYCKKILLITLLRPERKATRKLSSALIRSNLLPPGKETR